MTAALLATVDALGWALLHALWQLTALAALLWVALRLADARSAAARCWLCVAALLLAPVLFGLTAAQHWDLPAAEVASLAALSPAAAPGLAIDAPALASAPSLRVEDALPVLVGAWGLGVLLLGLAFLGGLLRTRRLQTEGLGPVPPVLSARVAALASSLGIRRPVSIASSSLVAVPSVVGLLKPVILLPPVVLTGLSTAQLESIVLHELAHIRRRDLWISLVQGLVEILLFFHPAVWWMSRRLRAEREQACDDIVVGQGTPPLLYARALLTLAEQPGGDRPVLSVAATDGSLQHRVERLVGRSKAPQRRGRGLAAAVLLGLLALGSVRQSVAADHDLGVMVASMLELEITLPEDAELSRPEQDRALQGALVALTDQHAEIMSRVEVLMASDPERWGLEVTVRVGQASEHIADAIANSDSPRYLDADQAAVYQGALLSKAATNWQKARAAYEKALAMGGDPSLLAEARAGLARVTVALDAAESRSVLTPEEDAAALVAQAESLQASDPDAGLFWLQTAELLLGEGDAAGALRWYLASAGALEGSAEATFARYRAAWCHYNLGQHDAAISMMQGVALSGVEPVGPEGLADLVRFYTDAGRAAEGEAWFSAQGAADVWAEQQPR